MKKYLLFFIIIKKITLFVFQLDISGNINNDEQKEKIPFISVALFVSHFDISGNDNKEEQKKKCYPYQLHY